MTVQCYRLFSSENVRSLHHPDITRNPHSETLINRGWIFVIITKGLFVTFTNYLCKHYEEFRNIYEIMLTCCKFHDFANFMQQGLRGVPHNVSVFIQVWFYCFIGKLNQWAFRKCNIIGGSRGYFFCYYTIFKTTYQHNNTVILLSIYRENELHVYIIWHSSINDLYSIDFFYLFGCLHAKLHKKHKKW